MDNNSIKKLETDLWEAADLLRQGSKLTSVYCIIKIPKVADKNGESCISILEKIA